MQRGFTLIELTIVVAIVAIVASMAMPKIGDWMASQDLTNAARELAADSRLLQQMAINTGGGTQPIMFFITSEPSGYYTTLNNKVIEPRSTLPKGIKLSAQTTSLTFNIHGEPVPGSALTLTLTRSDGKGTKQVIIERQTGRVRIQ